ncbi:MAG: acyltransferase family protein [Kiritimatiellia bacterium]
MGWGGNAHRNSSIELYRVCLMFGICLLHCAYHGGYRQELVVDLLRFCVDGFVFISGYYGLRFAPSKVIRLMGIAAVAITIAWVGGVILGITETLSVKRLIKSLISDNWFLYAYLALMLLAPVVDAALNATPTRKLPMILVPFLGLTFVWSYGLTLPIIGSCLPRISGLGSYTFVMMLGVYTVARLCHRFDLGQWLTRRRICCIVPVLLLIVGMGFGEYDSPFAVSLAMVMFILFSRIQLSRRMGQFVLLLAPSMFAVYLLHDNDTGRFLIREIMKWGVEGYGLSPYLAYPLCAVPIFVGCVLLDIPRRLIVRWTVPVWKPLLMRIDAVYARIVGDV